MLFTIIGSISPLDGDPWMAYCAWRAMDFETFESIDGILRPSLLGKLQGEDWNHIVQENFMLRFITDYDYARSKHQEIGAGDLVGVKFSDHDLADDRFLGFDLIDGDCDVSLLTNWGNDIGMINRALSPSALVPSLPVIENIQAELLHRCGNDPHVDGCRIVSIYRILPGTPSYGQLGVNPKPSP